MALEEVLLGLLIVVILLLLYLLHRIIASDDQQASLGDLFNTLKGLATNLGQLQTLASDVKSFSQEFQALLTAPKLRGGLGELLLEDLLRDALPAGAYRMGHGFPDGSIVDAVIESDRGLIPVDSKFPLAGLKDAVLSEDPDTRKGAVRRLRSAALKHIRDVSAKYVRPADGTVQFAVMYLPSQAPYEHLISDEAILEEARTRSVLLASPNTLYIFLRAILLGLQGKRMEEMAARVVRETSQLERDAKTLADDLAVLQGHLNRARNKLEDAALPSFRKLKSRIARLTALDVDTPEGQTGLEPGYEERESLESPTESMEIGNRPKPSTALTEVLKGLKVGMKSRKEKEGGSDADS